MRGEPWAQTLAKNVTQVICEMDDRTSPDDWPEALLVTADELHGIILEQAADLDLILVAPSDIATLTAIVRRMRQILGPRPGDEQLDAAEAVLAKIQETPDAG